MAIIFHNNVKVILNNMEQIRYKLEKITSLSELNAYFLVLEMKRLEALFTDSVEKYQELTSSGMTNSEVAGAFASFVYPAPVPGSTFVSINQAKNAFIASYENDVWPLFQGKTVDLVSGNHIDVDIIKPTFFNTAAQNFLNAIGTLIKVT